MGSKNKLQSDIQSENEALKTKIDTVEHQLRITERALERANIEILKLKREMQQRVSLDITEKRTDSNWNKELLQAAIAESEKQKRQENLKMSEPSDAQAVMKAEEAKKAEEIRKAEEIKKADAEAEAKAKEMKDKLDILLAKELHEEERRRKEQEDNDSVIAKRMQEEAERNEMYERAKEEGAIEAKKHAVSIVAHRNAILAHKVMLARKRSAIERRLASQEKLGSRRKMF